MGIFIPEAVNFDEWQDMELWLFLPLTFHFTLTQVPMLMKHGLSIEENDPSDNTSPPG